jgi:hypothetical protein
MRGSSPMAGPRPGFQHMQRSGLVGLDDNKGQGHEGVGQHRQLGQEASFWTQLFPSSQGPQQVWNFRVWPKPRRFEELPPPPLVGALPCPMHAD